MYVSMHFIVKNTSNKEMQLYRLNYVDCIVDGISQENFVSFDLNRLSSDYVKPGMMIDGYEVYEIPLKQNRIEIYYKNAVIIVDPKDVQILD